MDIVSFVHSWGFYLYIDRESRLGSVALMYI